MAGMVGMIGPLIQAAGTIYQGAQARATSDYNAAVAKEEAKTQDVLTDIEIARHRRSAKKLQSAQFARYGASGVTLEGSPILVMADSTADAELDEALIKFQGASKASALNREAKLQKMFGESALTASLINAGATLLPGAVDKIKGSSLLTQRSKPSMSGHVGHYDPGRTSLKG